MSPGSARAIAVVLALWATACTASPTQVVVVLTADAELESRTARLRVEVEGPDGLVLARSIDTGQIGEWPYRVPVVPAGDDARRWARLRARIEDASGALLGEQRAIFGYVEGERRWLVIRFASDCVGVGCGERTTCEVASCEDACRAPTREERWPAPVAPCPDAPSDDAGTPEHDAGDEPIDGGPRPDGGLRGVCASELEGVAFFDALDDDVVPAACGAPRCVVSIDAQITPLARGRDGDDAAACGEGSLELETRNASEPPAAYLVYPVPPDVASRDTVVVRAWVRLQSLVGEHPVLGIVHTAALDAVIEDGTALAVSADGHVALADRVGSNIIEDRDARVIFPTARWTCVELETSYRDGRVRAYLDGVLAGELMLPRRATGSASGVAHLRVGLFDLTDGDVRRELRVDDVIIDSMRRPCPPAGTIE